MQRYGGYGGGGKSCFFFILTNSYLFRLKLLSTHQIYIVLPSSLNYIGYGGYGGMGSYGGYGGMGRVSRSESLSAGQAVCSAL